MGALADGDGKSFGARYGYAVGELVEAGDWAGVESWLAQRRSRAVRVLVWIGGLVVAMSVLAGAAMLIVVGRADGESVARVVQWALLGVTYGGLVLAQGLELRDVERARVAVQALRRASVVSGAESDGPVPALD